MGKDVAEEVGRRRDAVVESLLLAEGRRKGLGFGRQAKRAFTEAFRRRPRTSP